MCFSSGTDALREQLCQASAIVLALVLLFLLAALAVRVLLLATEASVARGGAWAVVFGLDAANGRHAALECAECGYNVLVIGGDAAVAEQLALLARARHARSVVTLPMQPYPLLARTIRRVSCSVELVVINSDAFLRRAERQTGKAHLGLGEVTRLATVAVIALGRSRFTRTQAPPATVVLLKPRRTTAPPPGRQCAQQRSAAAWWRFARILEHRVQTRTGMGRMMPLLNASIGEVVVQACESFLEGLAAEMQTAAKLEAQNVHISCLEIGAAGQNGAGGAECAALFRAAVANRGGAAHTE